MGGGLQQMTEVNTGRAESCQSHYLVLVLGRLETEVRRHRGVEHTERVFPRIFLDNVQPVTGAHRKNCADLVSVPVVGQLDHKG